MDAEVSSVEKNLPQLDTYCWAYILKQLDLNALLKMSKVSAEFHELIRTHVVPAKVVNLILCEIKLWSEQELQDYLTLLGLSVHSIESCRHAECQRDDNFTDNWCKLPDSIADSIARFCVNLQELVGLRIKLNSLQQLVMRCKNLTKISLIGAEVTDADVVMFCDLPKLRCLEFCRNEELKGTFLYQLKQLTHLKIGFYAIWPENVLKLCQSYGHNLVYLDIREVAFSSTNQLREVLDCCPRLEWAILPIGYIVDSTVPKLKGLQIDDMELGVDGVFEGLARTQAKSLQVLRIEDFDNTAQRLAGTASYVGQLQQLKQLRCSLNDACLYQLDTLQQLQCLQVFVSDDISNGGILHVIKNCRNLYLLGLSSCSGAPLTEQLVYDAIELLREQQHLGQRTAASLPLWLLLDRKQIAEQVLKDPRYLSATSVLRIRYGRSTKGLLRRELQQIFSIFHDE